MTGKVPFFRQILQRVAVNVQWELWASGLVASFASDLYFRHIYRISLKCLNYWNKLIYSFE